MKGNLVSTRLVTCQLYLQKRIVLLKVEVKLIDDDDDELCHSLRAVTF